VEALGRIKKISNIQKAINMIKKDKAKVIVWRNAIGDWVNEGCNVTAQKKKDYVNKFKIGDKVICTHSLHMGKVNFFTNCKYTVEEIGSNEIMLFDGIEGRNQKIGSKLFYKWFRHSYYRTCHSAQGLSYNKPVIIFDYKEAFKRMGTDFSRWFYTAITRARNPNEVYLYDGDLPENGDLKFLKGLKKRISNHYMTDVMNKRSIDDDKYIDEDWIFEQAERQKFQCHLCNEKSIIPEDLTTWSID